MAEIPESCDALVAGGGYFGCMVSARLRRHGHSVLLCEMNSRLLMRASYNNQARVHNGYHYPRSLLTALRSHVNFPDFVREFRECIVDNFTKLYAIPRRLSKVSAAQFAAFTRRVGAPIRKCSAPHRKLFSGELIEEVFEVEEFAFDSDSLARISENLLRESGVPILLETEMISCLPRTGGGFDVILRRGEQEHQVRAGRLINCGYSRLNHNLRLAGLPPARLRQEIAEMCLVRPPPELQKLGVTVMCGPFFSFMPFPPRGLHTLSHVRYTPHTWWLDEGENSPDPYAVMAGFQRKSAYAYMVRDATRFLPALHHLQYVDSLWEVKTVLPRNDDDDGRPILFQKAAGQPDFISIMGGKIDNIFDCQKELERELSAHSCP
ncbi:MAG TPA: FAD-dependent oxidoreductase [Verrucomicrobiales bacterium]|jgi:glycine/D-amino acid oxidase-like deaminating enzyme|nr:FAD-dependent oxidoreductase [Verrucomicrobiales bacterium]